MKSKSPILTTRGGPLIMRILSVVSVLFPLLLSPIDSSAVSLTGDSNTYLQSRETADNARLIPFYEYLNVTVQDIGKETITFHFGGWLRYDFKDEEFGRRSNNDLQYAYLSFKSKENNSIVNLGRVMVFEGVASERVDGVYARTDLKAGFGISAFAGGPVETSIDEPGNNIIYGGRLSQQIPDVYRLGVSYLKEEKDSADFRKEEGVDLWVHPVNKVEILGRSSYNSVTDGWMEHAYFLSLGPFAKLRLNTEASRINYEDYFISATTSAFKLQAGILDPYEKVRILGEEASYPVSDNLMISADYKNYGYDIAGNADYYGGKVRYSAPAAGGAGLSLHRMAGETEKLKYSEYRIYGYKKLEKTDITIDLLDIVYDKDINGVGNAYSVSVAAVYDLKENLKVGADIEYAHNPDFDKDVRAFIKLLYRFGAVYGTEAGGAK